MESRNVGAELDINRKERQPDCRYSVHSGGRRASISGLFRPSLSKDYLVYLRLAEVDVLLKDDDSAENWVKKGLAIKRHSRFYSLMAIISNNRNDHPRVLAFIDQAYDINPNLFMEVDTMLAVSHSYEKTGDYINAKKILIKLSKSNPDATNYISTRQAIARLKKHGS